MSAVGSGAITPLLRTSGLACCPWAQVNHYVEGSTKSDKRPSITSYHNARPYTYLHQGWRRSICRRCARPAAARPETSRLDTPYPVSVRHSSLSHQSRTYMRRGAHPHRLAKSKTNDQPLAHESATRDRHRIRADDAHLMHTLSLRTRFHDQLVYGDGLQRRPQPTSESTHTDTHPRN